MNSFFAAVLRAIWPLLFRFATVDFFGAEELVFFAGLTDVLFDFDALVTVPEKARHVAWRYALRFYPGL